MDPLGTARDLVLQLCADARKRLIGEPSLFVRRIHDELAEPQLRLAVLGRVSAGKSTLVNAMLGLPVAPTDAGECTRSVVCFRYGEQPRAFAHLRTGDVLDLGAELPSNPQVPADEVAYLEARLPAEPLRRVTLIDCPGISSAGSDVSARTHELVSGKLGAAPRPDAIAFVLTQNVRDDEYRLLCEIDRSVSLTPSSVHTVGVLTKADLLGGGGPAAWDAARNLAASIATGQRGRLAEVVPVMGLLAEAGHCRRLTEDDAHVLATLAAEWDATDRGLALLAREICVAHASSTAPHERDALVERVGLGGVRVLMDAIDQGAGGAAQLNAVCRQHSGYDELRTVLVNRFRERADALKALHALAALNRAVHGALGRRMSPTVREWLLDRLEEVRYEPRTHRILELEVLHRVLAGEVQLPEVLKYDLISLVEDSGWTPGALGVEVWQQFATTAGSAAQREVARVVIRSHTIRAGSRVEAAR